MLGVGVRVPGVGVIVVVAVAGQLQDGEPEAGGDQDRAHNRVLGTLDSRTKLESDGDDHAAQHDRDQDMGHPGQAGEPGHAGERIASGASQDGQRHPVVGQDRVPEADPCGGGQEGRTVLSHARGFEQPSSRLEATAAVTSSRTLSRRCR
jgi:hypothetical protein